MIIGIGVDILDIKRIERLYHKFGDKFTTKIFTKQEIEFCKKRTRYLESLAKMFSIKEAVIKAISDVSGVFWHDIEVFHDKNGKPFIGLSGKALDNVKIKTQGNDFNFEVSVSDEIPLVCAFAILEML